MHEQLNELQERWGWMRFRAHRCFDISHSGGELAVASCVCSMAAGAPSRTIARFNIEGITPGDAYAAIRQALPAPLHPAQSGEGKLPDLR